MPASTQNTVTPFPERLVNRAAHGFDAVPGNRFDRTGLVNVRITPATMARALEYLLSMFTNAMEASRQFGLNSSAKKGTDTLHGGSGAVFVLISSIWSILGVLSFSVF